MNLTDIVVIFALVFIISLAVLGFFSRRRSLHRDKIVVGLTVVMVVAAGVSVYGDITREMVRQPGGYARTWNLFHHYLGAKYFPELGYFHLYSCSLAADAEMEGVWSQQTPVRDLTTYTIGPAQDVSPCPKIQFSAERWAWFRSDLLLLQQTSLSGVEQPAAGNQSPHLWRTILTDKGFNPSPVWATLGWWLTNRISLDSGWTLKLLLSLDIILIAVALGFTAWVFGWETAALVLLFLVTFWGPYRRVAGNIIQYGWLFSVLMGFGLWKLGRLRSSAAFFAYAIMARIFPLFFLAGLFLCWGKAIIKRETDTARTLSIFFGWLLLFCWLLFMGSFILPNAPAAWLEFYANIQRHGAVLHQEMLNVGLKNLISTCCDLVNTPDEFEYGRGPAGRYGLYYLLAGTLISLFVIYSLRRETSTLSLMSLGYIPMFALVTVSRYYYLGLAVMLLPHQNRRVAAIGLLGANLAVYVMRRFIFTQDANLFYSYWTVQSIYLFFFIGLLIPWPSLKSPTDAGPQQFLSDGVKKFRSQDQEIG